MITIPILKKHFLILSALLSYQNTHCNEMQTAHAKNIIKVQNEDDINKHFPELEVSWRKWRALHKIIKEWSIHKQEELGLHVNDVVFYPFAGVDLVFPISFFPDFKHLIMIGLEPVGKGFSLQAIDGIKLNLQYLLSHGNLVTRHMEQFAKSGVITLLIIQLKKLAAQDISYTLSENQVEITFKLNDIERKLTYMRINLSDENHQAWAHLFKKYRNFTLFMKSASFVPQQYGFHKIRDALIENASIILQDDTGIKYKTLKETDFKIHLYGSYYLPYNIEGLQYFFQKELKEAYEKEKPEPLMFAIGYRSESVPGNILWAYRVQKYPNTYASQEDEEDETQLETLD